MEYTPDCWIVVKITNNESKKFHHRVFANWYGGYLNGDSWKLNSGITKVEVDDNHYLFHGSSGSVYRCHKNNYSTSGYGAGVLANIIDNSPGVTVEPLEEQDWTTVTLE
jgi:hypothetical protein